jgi:hypothetical protein
MGNVASKLGPVTGYWILIIAALLMAKLFNWVDIENTYEMIKYVGMISVGYVVLYGALHLFKKFKK